MATKVQFTVGKLDAGMAILLTRDPKESMHLVEFPSVLLPSGVKSGSIIDISVAQNPTEEDAENEAFSNLQEDILAQFGTAEPKTPELRLRNATQTSVVLEWDPVEIATAELRSLALYKNNARLGNIPDPLHNTSTKLSGLAIDTAYSFHLVLKTSAGTYTSPKLNVKTHKMTDLTGLQICVSDTPPLTAEEQTALMASLQAIGAREPQTNVKIDTTHFICKEPRGPEWEKANEMNIPIVVPEWVTACEREGRLVGVKAYYLGAD
ncbi:chitin biosynthesis protein CHS5, partial [Saitoella complicata NRRL Y-17804]